MSECLVKPKVEGDKVTVGWAQGLYWLLVELPDGERVGETFVDIDGLCEGSLAVAIVDNWTLVQLMLARRRSSELQRDQERESGQATA